MRFPDETWARCGCCDLVADVDDFEEAQDLAQRIAHGEPFTTLACPCCGALAHEVKGPARVLGRPLYVEELELQGGEEVAAVVALPLPQVFGEHIDTVTERVIAALFGGATQVTDGGMLRAIGTDANDNVLIEAGFGLTEHGEGYLNQNLPRARGERVVA